MMNSIEIFRGTKRKNSAQGNADNIELNFSKVKQQLRFDSTIYPKNKRISNASRDIKRTVKNNANLSGGKKKKASIPTDHRRSSCLYQYRNIILENENSNPKTKRNSRRSQELHLIKTTKFFQKYNEQNNIDVMLNKTSVQLKNIQKDIKKAIHNMKKEIQKKEEGTIRINSLQPNTSKLTSSPNLQFFFTLNKVKSIKNKKSKKFEYLNGSLVTKEKFILNDNSFRKEMKKKRNNSFDYNGHIKKKIMKRIRDKMYKKHKNNSTLKNKNDSSSDETDNINNYRGHSIPPTNTFIFIFDFLLILANLYTFIVIPLSVAQNHDIRERGHLATEIIHYTIDLLYLLDLVICLFKGYYDHKMKIIRNNRLIIKHYMKKYFVSDFLEAIPLYTIIRIAKSKNIKSIYLGYSKIEIIYITFLLFIKPFKIFKIIKKKQNKVLEDFYSYVIDNYYLEKMVNFIIYFLTVLLFVHLFICLHIYFALQSYPNWMIHTNTMNESFFTKYITSLYFMITTMTTVGYGDIVCISFIERLYHIFLLVLGTLLYTFIVSKIGNILRDESHEQIKLSKDLTILENLRISYPTMSYNLYSKIKNHLLSIFNKRKKTGISLLINGVPDAIKNDLLFKIYSKVINGFKIFKNVNNSNFVVQMLTNFIPIVSKKEEIIILEGEIIQNIVFVKDGRLSIEIAIDLNNPYQSIHKYLEINFLGISRQEEIQNHNYLKKVKSMMNANENNYNDLKEKIDNLLSSNKKRLVDNSTMDNNGISVDLGRLDFSRNDIEHEQGDILHIIKVIDIRKNEHFGDVHMFLEKPSPFTIKAKSRIAELLLLRKHDAMVISKTFPNIWRKIENKSYHNLVSFKKLTFQILKRYYMNHLYNKNKETNITFNFDATRNMISEYSNSRIFFGDNNKSNKSMNKSIGLMNRSYNKSISLQNKNYNQSISINNKSVFKKSSKSMHGYHELEKVHLKPTKTKNYGNNLNKKKLFIGYNVPNRNSLGDNFSDNLNFSSDSSNYNSFQSSKYKIANSVLNTPTPTNKKEPYLKEPMPIISINREYEEENDQVLSLYNSNNQNQYLKINTNKEIINKKSNDELTFKSESNKQTISSPQNFLETHKTYKNSTLIKSNDILKSNVTSKKYTDREIKEFINDDTLKRRSTKNENSDSNDFITLEDVDKRFSKKIRKRMKRRNKIQKLKEIFRLQKLKIDKNLNNSFQNQSNLNINIFPINTINNAIYSNNKNISQVIESTSSEGGSTTLIQENQNFDKHTLKVVSNGFFQIKSSYKNINSLSKGNMINNIDYQKNLEYLIKKYLNIKFMDDNYFQSIISLNSQKSRNSRNKIINLKICETERNQKVTFSDKKSMFSKAKSRYSPIKNNDEDNSSQKKTIKNSKISIKNSKISKKRKEKKKKEEKKSDKFIKNDKNNLDEIKKSEIELKERIDTNDKLKVNEDINKGKQLYNYKKNDKEKQEINNSEISNDVNDKVNSNSSNVLNGLRLFNKDNNLTLLNKKFNINSCTEMIQINNINEQKTNNCIIT